MKNKLFIRIITSLALLVTGFITGINYKELSTKIPQGVILNDGPGLHRMQLVTDEFLLAWNNGDARGCAETYSIEAVYMPPKVSPIKGREAIMRSYEDDVSKNPDEMSITEEVQEVIYFGDWATMRGSGEISIQNRDSSIENSSYNWVMLSKKNSQGEWESVWDIYN